MGVNSNCGNEGRSILFTWWQAIITTCILAKEAWSISFCRWIVKIYKKVRMQVEVCVHKNGWWLIVMEKRYNILGHEGWPIVVDL